MINKFMTEWLRQYSERVDAYLRLVLLKELGEEFYSKTDLEIAEEANKRGYVVEFHPGENAYSINKDGTVIGKISPRFEIKKED